MSENTVYNYADTSTRLAKVIQDLDVEIRVSEQSMKLKTKYEEELVKLEANISLCNGVLEKLKPLLADTK